MRVLIADDAALVRRALAIILEDQGHVVVEAGTGGEAVTRYFANRPDLVLMDVAMPGMNGVTTADLIRREDGQARIVFISAVVSDGLVRAAQRLGALGVLLKPLDVGQLHKFLEVENIPIQTEL
ncbi:response regulator transcription factor [Caldinitratiruptor microaerophilus]|uniref:Stage 0 sporulation protein A homolog n=1 Tax=Caldinitratiruptor microaerophilus TaxID=671077 RepID=A0AA35CJW7_9FIRM|nr:response regulator transcription factor [Caldinitratiruptor microaerophilus]BDG60557.1 response regulator [Caldinitratiruptor microaerophilus]